MKNRLLFYFVLPLFTLFTSCKPTTEVPQEPNEQSPEPPANVTVYDESGTLPGYFSVSPYSKVRFSRGNLNYNETTDTWSFNENQYDFISMPSETPNRKGIFDEFGWATSGYQQKPTLSSSLYEKYYSGMKNISGTMYDWGFYNKISNGGNKEGMWRTMTASEWEYVICQRTDWDRLLSYAAVHGNRGFIIMPDSWEDRGDELFYPKYYVKSKRLQLYYDDVHVYTDEAWDELEKQGAVFFPFFTNYWTASPGKDISVAYYVFMPMAISLGAVSISVIKSHGRQYDGRVRLVR